jgi:hypothetical protein
VAVLSIPVALVGSCPDGELILRIAEPAAMSVLFESGMPERIAYIQVNGAAPDLAPLADWGEGVPIDLVLRDPAAELPWLYRAMPLLERHPVRVTIPLVAGLARAVRLAVSLGLPARLVGHQPVSAAVDEAREALRGYLHNPTVAQPVEPFHGLLFGLIHGRGTEGPVRLWTLMECDPEEVQVLDEAGVVVPDAAPPSVAVFRDALLAGGAECNGCAWFPFCEGYFKWPRTDYDCTGVRSILDELAAAAAELRAGLAEYAARLG